MGKRWTTGQEILDEFGLQPFELRDIIAATKEGKTLSGQEVGYAAYLVQLNGTYPITGRHIEIARSMPSAIMAYERLEEIEKQRQAETVYQQDGVTMSLHIGNNTPLDERIGAYYVLTPSKYKTQTGIDIELFFNDIPTFVFTEDEYATIKRIVVEEGLAPAEDDPAPVAGGQDGLTEQGASKDELVEQLLSQKASTPQAIAQILMDFQISSEEAARRLKAHKVILKEIGRVLREEGEFDSDDANIKRAQRLLSN